MIKDQEEVEGDGRGGGGGGAVEEKLLIRNGSCSAC